MEYYYIVISFAPCIKPTGKAYSFQAADLYRIGNGKIAEHRDDIEIIYILQKITAIKFTLNPPICPYLKQQIIKSFIKIIIRLYQFTKY